MSNQGTLVKLVKKSESLPTAESGCCVSVTPQATTNQCCGEESADALSRHVPQESAESQKVETNCCG